MVSPLRADTLRLAVFNVGLSRDGPGLLLRDLRRGDAQARAAATMIAKRRPDVLLLLDFDYDHGQEALMAFEGLVAGQGAAYPYRMALRPNTGIATGRDLDGDGRRGGPGDAQGFGFFAGDGGMAILSRLPLEEPTDYSGFLWAALPGNLMGDLPGRDVQRLSSTGHWSVPVRLADDTRLHLLAFHATPPVFDGPEDRNGRRNHDEILFWARLLDGALPFAPPQGPFAVMGDANLDPHDSDGRGEAIAALLSHPAVQDPEPRGPPLPRDGPNARHCGDPALDTADWEEVGKTGAPGPGNLRVDYILPSARLHVAAGGLDRPPPGSGLRHALVWVELSGP